MTFHTLQVALGLTRRICRSIYCPSLSKGVNSYCVMIEFTAPCTSFPFIHVVNDTVITKLYLLHRHLDYLLTFRSHHILTLVLYPQYWQSQHPADLKQTEKRSGTPFGYSAFTLLSSDDVSCQYVLTQKPQSTRLSASGDSNETMTSQGRSAKRQDLIAAFELNCNEETTSSLDEDFIHSVCCGTRGESVTCSHFVTESNNTISTKDYRPSHCTNAVIDIQLLGILPSFRIEAGPST